MPNPPTNPFDLLFERLAEHASDFMDDLIDDVRERHVSQQREAIQRSRRQAQVPRPRQRPQTAPKPTKAPTPSPTAYDVLGVAPAAPQAVVDAAHRALSRVYHPDINKTKRAGEMMKMINAAYQCVKSEAVRKEYNRKVGL